MSRIADNESVERHLDNIKQIRLRNHREFLIQKHLEGWNGLERASIENYAATGKVSGSLFSAIQKIMQEYREFQPTKNP